jgi:hypothetical protein
MSTDLERDQERLHHEGHRIAHELVQLYTLMFELLLQPNFEREIMSQALDALNALTADASAYADTSSQAIRDALTAAAAGGGTTGVAEADVQAAVDAFTTSWNDLKAKQGAAIAGQPAP